MLCAVFAKSQNKGISEAAYRKIVKYLSDGSRML